MVLAKRFAQRSRPAVTREALRLLEASAPRVVVLSTAMAGALAGAGLAYLLWRWA